MRRNSVGWNDASANHINRTHEKMIMKGRSAGKTTQSLEDIPEGVDATHMLGDGLAYATPADLDQLTAAQLAHIHGGANLEAARAEYELSAKRSAIFFAIRRQAEADLAALFHGPALLKSGLFRTVSDRAMLCAWGWQLEADFMPDVGQR